jgi:selenocysteine-specific elongation factor
MLARGDRFIVRTYSPPRTIAGGHILDPKPPRTAIRSQAALDRCRRLDFDPTSEDLVDAQLQAATVMLEDAGEAGMPVAALVSRVGVEPASLAARVQALADRGAAIQVHQRLVARPVFDRLKAALVQALAQHHDREPLSEGLAREEARVRLFGRGHPSIFARALEDLAAEGKIIARERVALASHHVEWPPEATGARDAIDRVFRDAGLAPPDAAAVAGASGVAPAVVDQVLRLLQRQKVLVKVDTLLFHNEALKRLKEEVATMKASGGADAGLDVPAFKERFGVTRKFAIPLLEYLDRERVTRRMGNARVIL